MKTCIKTITQNRNDAIGIYNRNLIKHLPDTFANIHIGFRKFYIKPIDYFIEFFLIFSASRRINKTDSLLFTDPYSIKANLAFILENKKASLFFHYDDEPAYYKKLPFLNMSIKKLLKRFDAVIASSLSSRDYLIREGFAEHKVFVCYPGINHKVFYPRKCKKIFDYKYIIHVGTENCRKNIERVLLAFATLSKEFPSLMFVKTGIDHENRKSTLALIKQLGIEDRLIFTGRVSENELARYYSNAELLLFPSLLEGFGFPVAEAMACGCPVVTSERTPMQEIAGDTQVLCNPGSVSSIVSACREVLRDEKLLRQMSVKGIERAKMFRWEKTAAEISRIMESL